MNDTLVLDGPCPPRVSAMHGFSAHFYMDFAPRSKSLGNETSARHFDETFATHNFAPYFGAAAAGQRLEHSSASFRGSYQHYYAPYFPDASIDLLTRVGPPWYSLVLATVF